MLLSTLPETGYLKNSSKKFYRKKNNLIKIQLNQILKE